jgi:hypothetical protein
MGRKFIFILVFIAVIFLFLKIIPKFGSDTERIRNIIIAAKDAVEKRDLMKCASFVSKDYLDKYGHNKGEFLFIAKNAFAEYGDILIIIEEMKIDVESSTKAKAHVLASGQGKKEIAERFNYDLDADRAEFIVTFNKEGRHWKVTELDFIQPEDFLLFLKGL